MEWHPHCVEWHPQCGVTPPVWSDTPSVEWHPQCGVTPPVWSDTPSVEWHPQCGVTPPVWSDTPSVEWHPQCGVTPPVWSDTPSVEWHPHPQCGVTPPVWSDTPSVERHPRCGVTPPGQCNLYRLGAVHLHGCGSVNIGLSTYTWFLTYRYTCNLMIWTTEYHYRDTLRRRQLQHQHQLTFFYTMWYNLLNTTVPQHLITPCIRTRNNNPN